MLNVRDFQGGKFPTNASLLWRPLARLASVGGVCEEATCPLAVRGGTGIIASSFLARLLAESKLSVRACIAAPRRRAAICAKHRIRATIQLPLIDQTLAYAQRSTHENGQSNGA